MTLTGNFDKLNKAKAEEKGNTEMAGEKEIDLYPTAGQTRNLCFVLTNQKRLSLNYAYLVCSEYNPEGNSIVLTYTTHKVTLKGRNLESLHEDIDLQRPKRITCLDKRYEATKGDNEVSVTEILIG